MLYSLWQAPDYTLRIRKHIQKRAVGPAVQVHFSKGPCRSMVHTVAFKGLTCHDLQAHVCTVINATGPFGFGHPECWASLLCAGPQATDSVGAELIGSPARLGSPVP